MNIKWKYQQDTLDGRWTSEKVFEGDDRAAKQGVIAGHLLGHSRAAIEEGTGRVIYALDVHGQATPTAVKIFNEAQLIDARSACTSTGAPWARGPDGATVPAKRSRRDNTPG